MTSRPLAFIDVDGVLNRNVSDTVSRKRGYLSFVASQFVDDLGESYGHRFRIRGDLDDARRLARLTPTFDLAWGTTWEGAADTQIANRLHLPRGLPHAHTEVHEASKAPGVLRLAAGRPFVWFDDSLDENDKLILAKSGVDHLVIDVDAPYVTAADADVATGLTDAHIDTALSWARSRRTQ